MKVLIVFLSLVAGNFAYQFFYADPNFVVATERSWFQGTALFTYWLMERFVWND